MAELVQQVVHIGTDWYGRRVTATRTKEGANGKWKIEVHPSSQQDDGERIFSLTDENMRDMVRVVELIKK